MKKFVSGFIIGALLMLSTQAFGESIGYLGKKVDGQASVKVNGDTVGQAVIIEGKSFAPVRDIVNSMGGVVESTTGGVISLSTNTESSSVTEIDELHIKINGQQATVDRISNLVTELNKKIDGLASQGIDPITQNIEMKLMKEQLTKETTTLEKLKLQLDELQK